MEESPYVTEVSMLAPESFSVLDAAVARWIGSEFIVYNDVGNLGRRWIATSSGSSHHTLTSYDKPVWHINLRAVDAQHTVIQFLPLQAMPRTELDRRLAAFWAWFRQQRSEDRQLPLIDESEAQPADFRNLVSNLPEPKRRGPAPAAHNVWARQQVRLGRTIDELLEEYMQRQGQDFRDDVARQRAREALRKTIERARR